MPCQSCGWDSCIQRGDRLSPCGRTVRALAGGTPCRGRQRPSEHIQSCNDSKPCGSPCPCLPRSVNTSVRMSQIAALMKGTATGSEMTFSAGCPFFSSFILSSVCVKPVYWEKPCSGLSPFPDAQRVVVEPCVFVEQQYGIIPLFDCQLHPDVVGSPKPEVPAVFNEPYLRILLSDVGNGLVTRPVIQHHDVAGIVAVEHAVYATVQPRHEIV